MALVSGGNRGLGLKIVRGLAERGMRVVMCGRQVERGRRAVELLGDLAERVGVRQLDVTDQASVDRLASWLRARLGREPAAYGVLNYAVNELTRMPPTSSLRTASCVVPARRRCIRQRNDPVPASVTRGPASSSGRP